MHPLFRRLETRAPVRLTPGARRPRRFHISGIRTAAFAALAALLALALYPGGGAAAFRRAPVNGSGAAASLPAKAAVAELSAAARGRSTTGKESRAAVLPSAPLAAMFQAAAATEEIDSFAGDCATPKTIFEVDETVCVKVGGTLLGGSRVYWVNPAGAVVQTDAASLTAPSATRTVSARGIWKLYLVSSDVTLRKIARFVVRDAANKAADLTVVNELVRGSGFAAGGAAVYRVTVTNNGPDPASNVGLTESAPAGLAFASATQPTGRAACSGTGPTTCAVGVLAVDETVTYTFAYTVNASTPAGTEIETTAAVTNGPETDLHAGDNTSSSINGVVNEAGAGVSCVLTCPANIVATANATLDGQPGAYVQYSAASGAGDCGAVSNSAPTAIVKIVNGEPQTPFFPVGTHTVTSSGQSGSGCTFTVKVLNTAAPTVTCPAAITATAGPDGTATPTIVTPAFTASGGGSVVGVRTDSTPATFDDDGDLVTPAVVKALTDPYPTGITGITWTVTDADGRTASCRQSVIVGTNTCGDDDEDPVITSAPPNVTAGTGPGNVGNTVALDDELGQLEATDNCSVVVTVSGVPPGNAFPVGTTTVTHTATDGAGNSVSHSQQVTVVDDTAPYIAAPANATYVCRSAVPAAAASQATRGDVRDDDGAVLLPPGPPFDNSGTVNVTVTESDNGGAGSASSPLVITRVFKATDPSNNSSESTQTITVVDATPPTISAPADATYECAAQVPAANASQATASDECAVSVAVAQTDNGGAGSVASPLVITRTFTATDAAGNASSAVQTITVKDTTPPTVTPPSDITAYLLPNSTDTGRAVTYPNPATAVDNCGGPVNITYSPASGSTFPVGTTQVTVTATDDHGKSATATFNVTVLYNFTGFFSPVGNLPVLNNVNAGRSIPLKFSLSGSKGLGILAAGYPASQAVACDSSAPVSELEGTETPGGSTLTYDAGSDQYHYNWKTEKAWAGTCRRLVVKLNDGSEHKALFKFK